MKRIANTFTELSLAFLFFVVSAHAQSGQRITASIPFEFTVGTVSLPAGQYEFLRADDEICQIRDSNGRSVFALASTSVEADGLPEKSFLKFATVGTRHVLTQLWNDRADTGYEFSYEHTALELAAHATVDGNHTDRR
jgi:hypothetical protein